MGAEMKESEMDGKYYLHNTIMIIFFGNRIQNSTFSAV